MLCWSHRFVEEPRMQLHRFLTVFTVSTSLAVPAGSVGQSARPASQPNGQPWKVDGAVAFTTAGLAVDADGAPDSYLADGKGLSETCVGVVAVVDGKRVTKKTDHDHWYAICQKAWADAQASGDYSHVAIFGFLGDKNGPLLQKEGDPLPGKAYITTTTMTVPGTPDKTQRHWVDANKVPYVVLSPAFRSSYGVKAGDLAVVYRPKTSAIGYAVFADGGDLGEGSVRLHKDLGNDPISMKNGVARANRGISDQVLTVVFPGVNVPGSVNADAWNQAIRQTGEAKLKAWGGQERLRACLQAIGRS